jgi:outer membrane protein assembly factor BamB
MKVLIVAAVVIVSSSMVGHGEDWPRWRGPDRTGTSTETGLLQQWPKDGPPLAWKISEIGEGMGGVAVSGGRIYTTGDSEGSAWLLALNEADGKQVWKAKIGRGGRHGFIYQPAGPRATPAVHGDRIYILGQYGELVCFTTEGKEVWRTDYVKDLGGILPVWGYTESPLVDGDKIICMPGDPEGTIAAIDKQTGKLIWKCKVPEGPTNRRYGNASSAGYASAIAIDFEGVRHYAQFTATTLVGVAAADGRLLWRYDRPANTHRIPCSTPIYHEGLVFAASAYDAGGGAVKLTKKPDGSLAADEVYFSPRMKNHHGGMVLVNDFLYSSFDPGILTCVEFKTGKVQWQDRTPGKGTVGYADGRLYCRNERDGAVYLVEANPKEYVEHGRLEQPDRSEEQAWTHPVIANGKLYLRDQNMLLCYDIKAR